MPRHGASIVWAGGNQAILWKAPQRWRLERQIVDTAAVRARLPGRHGAPPLLTDPPAEWQRSIAVLSRDLFFGMRIRNALGQMGYVPDLRKTEVALAEAMATPECVLALVDFNDEVNWASIRETIQRHPGIPVIAFGPHTDTETFRTAREACARRVISNAAFSQQLPDLVDRYARKS